MKKRTTRREGSKRKGRNSDKEETREVQVGGLGAKRQPEVFPQPQNHSQEKQKGQEEHETVESEGNNRQN